MKDWKRRTIIDRGTYDGDDVLVIDCSVWSNCYTFIVSKLENGIRRFIAIRSYFFKCKAKKELYWLLKELRRKNKLKIKNKYYEICICNS